MPHRSFTELIPEHLKPYVAHQDASLYTAMDHAAWRFILKISKAFFSGNAHQKYLDGLKETGISTDRIPRIEEMDECLKAHGWRAVAVNGFIPPAAFMEFQSLGILPIACEMRTLDHLAYTPAPDIVHEAAGHAPIIADPEYAAYLKNYGEVSRKALSSRKDMEVYEAIARLSVVKEDPSSTAADIDAAQKALDRAIESVDYLTESTYLARMNWWTVEYGLVGDEKNPKIYGAGLLSSVGESYHCLSSEVKKIPFTLACIETPYDITRPQPQLFVTKNFGELTQVLEEFARTMAFRIGGAKALAKALRSATVSTTVLNSGLQISGVIEKFDVEGSSSGSEDVSFIRWKGPVQLAFEDREIEDQGPTVHGHGFSTPLGAVRLPGGKVLKDLSDVTDSQLSEMGFTAGKSGKIVFASGIELTGRLAQSFRKKDKTLILTFDPCEIKKGSEVLYQPAWGRMDLACGGTIPSVFGGAADRAAYMRATKTTDYSAKKHKSNLTDENRPLNALYEKFAKARAQRNAPEVAAIVDQLDQNFPEDWLLRMEILEAQSELGLKLESRLRARLAEIAKTRKDRGELIDRGLKLLGMEK
ncbi:MAG: aromatic amino acid hydroxylase [Bdellovibrionales bacterium]|nr:aromatic amino acid hydroxylase [Bdellovibrionales bacterium]